MLNFIHIYLGIISRAIARGERGRKAGKRKK